MKILFFTLYLLHLHSTMYLLKLPAISKITSFYSVFTFHYVSIKTKTRLSVMSIQNYLHSTMYLLKLRLSGIPTACLTKFTFHYVSIKTHLCSLQFLFQKDLHSTMYLLKLLSISVWISDLTNLHSTMYLLKPWTY